MTYRGNILLICVIFLVFAKVIQGKDVKMEFEKSELVPDIISTAPTRYVNVTYANITVDLGNELTPSEASFQPEVKFDGETENLYTLAVVDPDAPSRTNHTYRSIRHWLVVNIPGQNITEGDIKSEYFGPSPPVGVGLHRYVFLVYQQDGEIEVEVDENRRSFNIEKFAQEYGLTGPLFGNYFQAQNV